MACELASQLMSDDVLPLLIIFGSIVIFVLAGVGSKTVRALSRERTRREIAAYIAEGSMTPEQGDRLMNSRGRDREA